MFCLYLRLGIEGVLFRLNPGESGVLIFIAGTGML
jgi:hypothetical protein